jgi:DNA-binding LacI/PurR family transcriptional regulator
MGRSKLTIKEIARALNISKSTVSRALRDQHDVKQETRQRVLAYAHEHDYHPDFMARSLRSKRTRTIGVIVPAHNIPFYSIAICGIQDYAMQQGYHVMVCHSSEKYEVEKENVEALLAADVEGIIISVARDTELNEHISKLRRKGIPLVMFNRVIEDFRAAKVVVDDYYGAAEMVRYLISTGCRRIAHISGPPNLLLSSNRKQGYMDALREAGIDFSEDWIREGDFTIESGSVCMAMLLEGSKDLDAVFCVCDAVAFGAIKTLKEKGYRIPEDMSVAGFTNEPMAELIEPALTTVAQPIYDIGETASRLLFAQLENPDLPPEFCVLNTKLIIRDSTRKPR